MAGEAHLGYPVFQKSEDPPIVFCKCPTRHPVCVWTCSVTGNLITSQGSLFHL